MLHGCCRAWLCWCGQLHEGVVSWRWTTDVATAYHVIGFTHVLLLRASHIVRQIQYAHPVHNTLQHIGARLFMLQAGRAQAAAPMGASAGGGDVDDDLQARLNNLRKQ